MTKYQNSYNSTQRYTTFRFNINYFLFTIVMYFLISAASYLFFGVAPIANLLDELWVLSIFVIVIPNLLTFKFSRLSFKLFMICLVIFSIGLASALFNSALIGLPVWTASLTEAIIGLKVYIIALFMLLIPDFYEPDVLERFIIKLCKIILVYSILNLLMTFADVLRGSDIHGRDLTKYLGISIPHGLFDVKYKTAFTSLLGLTCLLALSPSKVDRWLWIVLIVSFCASIILIASVKEISAAIAIFTLYMAQKTGSFYRVALVAVVGMGLMYLLLFDNIVADVFADRFSIFLNTKQISTVRTMMYFQAPNVAMDYFPFGSGWGTFGSSAARDIFYSPLYETYNVSDLHGGSEENGGYLIDTFWPKIVAELGFIGATVYLYLWIFGVKSIIYCRKIVKHSVAYRFGTYMFVGSFIVSVATPVYNYADGAIFNGIGFAVLILLLFNERYVRKNRTMKKFYT